MVNGVPAICSRADVKSTWEAAGRRKSSLAGFNGLVALMFAGSWLLSCAGRIYQGKFHRPGGEREVGFLTAAMPSKMNAWSL